MNQAHLGVAAAVLWVISAGACSTDQNSQLTEDDVRVDSSPSDTSPSDSAATEDIQPTVDVPSVTDTDVDQDNVTDGPSWCEAFCASMEDGCPNGQAFSDKNCLGECVASAVGECSEQWVEAEACIGIQSDWSCGEDGHSSPPDPSCTEELRALRTCLGPPNPCDPSPCGPHESCVADEQGEAYCSSDAEEWCTALTNAMLETCPEFLENPAMHTALCIQNSTGPCALECAVVRNCVPEDVEIDCDPKAGAVPKDGACKEEIAAMIECTYANGSVP